ncbi:hypothetical protein [Burkholderia pseudomallei]|uniref:hypothetical protein n=1 Tax=Burkholderia pseudomallei TaxID=28450 RepID=UPI0012AFC21E|nr:hypothetical protein [Burkholderia pseudomallei]
MARWLDGSTARRLDGSVCEADVPIVDVRMGRSVDAPLCRRAEPTSRGDGSIEGAKAPPGGGAPIDGSGPAIAYETLFKRLPADAC